MTDSKQKSAYLKFKGECTIYEIADLCEKLSELLCKAPMVTLDLSLVERVDVSFLQMLVSAKIEAGVTQTRLILSNPAENVRLLIESLYFHHLIDSPVKSLIDSPVKSSDAGEQ